MKTAAKPRGPHHERTERTRVALIDAAVELIAERGLWGFSLTEVEARAGVGRALAVYHFRTAQGLVHAAVQAAFSGVPVPSQLYGLEGLRDWWAKLQSWAAENPSSAATLLHVTIRPWADDALDLAKKRYWATQTEALRSYLSQLQALRQLRPEINLEDGAAFVLDQWHGALLRKIQGTLPTTGTLERVEAAILQTPTPQASSEKSRRKASPTVGVAQPELF